ncbi:uncharacterized protein F4817DRAFT_155416 [Daldinia loculata]|uniref:uncharacterized protein n=1 Tax=Daldinia loculata TaxID=103429 RepID=UPI0020C2A9C7|nr:uncharacterized protein F4817DRAFT_155416 [Daldinia loculata]KAI1646030.1 hypothetical protein F4817DRAFT_155416 [Daldinia loculata]
MKTKEASSPPSTPIFRIRVLDAVIEVPFKHHISEGPIIGDALGPDLSQQPEHSSSPSNNSPILKATTTITTTNDINHNISSPPSPPRTSRFQDDFLALLTLLPAQRYPPSPSSPTLSFYSADCFDREGDVDMREDYPSNNISSGGSRREDGNQTALARK